MLFWTLDFKRKKVLQIIFWPKKKIKKNIEKCHSGELHLQPPLIGHFLYLSCIIYLVYKKQMWGNSEGKKNKWGNERVRVGKKWWKKYSLSQVLSSFYTSAFLQCNVRHYFCCRFWYKKDHSSFIETFFLFQFMHLHDFSILVIWERHWVFVTNLNF